MKRKRNKVRVRLKTKITNNKKRRKVVLVVTLLFALIAGAAFSANRISKFLLTSSIFNVKSTEIKGNEIVGAKAVSDYLDFQGKNVFCINLKKSELLLKERFPVI